MTREPRKFNVAIFGVFALLCSFILWFEITSFHFQQYQVAHGGVLNLTSVSPTSSEVIPLSGEWTFYPDQLLTPTEVMFKSGRKDAQTILVPKIWGMGSGTYSLHVRLNPSEQKLFNAIDIPSISSAYRFWINGQLVHTSGTIGTGRQNEVAADNPGMAVIATPSNQLDIVVEVSNYVQQKGGIGESILLGNVNTLNRLQNLRRFLQLFIIGSLFIIGLYYMSFYIQRRKDRFSLYFALLCLDVSVQTLLLNSLNLVDLIPRVGWIFETKAEYLSESVLMVLLALVIKTLYPIDSSRILTRFFLGVGTIFSALFILTPPWIFTYFLSYLSLSGVLILIYALYVFIKAVRAKREDSWVHLLSLVFFAAAGANDIFYYLNIIKTGNLLPEGLYVFVLVQNLTASQRHASALSDLEKRTQELTLANSDLETRIQDRTRDLERTMGQLRQTNERLTELSMYDTLTSILNRNYFDTLIPDLWKEATTEARFLIVLFADIDYFKEYNDTYGHVQGDTCLREVAVAIERHLKPYEGAFVARYGGEEFVIVIPNIHPQYASEIGDRLREEVLHLGIPHTASLADSVVSISLGVTGVTAAVSEHWQNLIESADKALYEAKRQGRNRVVFRVTPS